MEEAFEKMLPIFRKAADTPEQISREEKKASLAAGEEAHRRAEVARAERRAQRASLPRRTLEQSVRTEAAARNAPYPNSAVKRASEAIQRFALKSQTIDLRTFPRDGIRGFACLRTSYDDNATWDRFKQRLDSKVHIHSSFCTMPMLDLQLLLSISRVILESR